MQKNYQNPKILRRKATTEYAVKQALVVQGDSFSDLDEDEKTGGGFMLAMEEIPVSYGSSFVFLVNTENEKEIKVILINIMENLDNYFAKKIKKLSNVLIDSVC